MNDVNDIFIGANAIKLGHLVIRQVRALHGESPTTVRKTNHSPLLFSELKHGQIPTWPLTDRLRFRSIENTRFTRVTPIELCGCRPDIIVLSQIQKAKMARMRRRKSGHLHIVAHQVLGLRKLVQVSLKELFLVIPTGAPRQHTAHVQVFAQNMPHHVFRCHTFSRRFVMRASRGVHMMVTRVPAKISQLDPSFEPKGFPMSRGIWHLNLPL